MECPIKTPVTVIETNGSIVDDESEMILKVLYSHKTFDLQVQQLHYAAKAINCHEKFKKLTQYKDYVESRIIECKIPNEWLPLCFKEWEVVVSELANDLEQALKEAEK